MGIEAELHDGTVLEFPDGTNPDVIQRTVRRQLGLLDTGEQPPSAAEVDRASQPATAKVGRNLTGPAPTDQTAIAPRARATQQALPTEEALPEIPPSADELARATRPAQMTRTKGGQPMFEGQPAPAPTNVEEATGTAPLSETIKSVPARAALGGGKTIADMKRAGVNMEAQPLDTKIEDLTKLRDDITARANEPYLHPDQSPNRKSVGDNLHATRRALFGTARGTLMAKPQLAGAGSYQTEAASLDAEIKRLTTERDTAAEESSIFAKGIKEATPKGEGELGKMIGSAAESAAPTLLAFGTGVGTAVPRALGAAAKVARGAKLAAAATEGAPLVSTLGAVGGMGAQGAGTHTQILQDGRDAAATLQQLDTVGDTVAVIRSIAEGDPEADSPAGRAARDAIKRLDAITERRTQGLIGERAAQQMRERAGLGFRRTMEQIAASATAGNAKWGAVVQGIMEGVGEKLALGVALRPGTPIFARILNSLAAEGGQEFATQGMQTLDNYFRYDKTITLQDALHDMLIAGGAGAVMGATLGPAGHVLTVPAMMQQAAQRKDAERAEIDAAARAALNPDRAQLERVGGPTARPNVGDTVSVPRGPATQPGTPGDLAAVLADGRPLREIRADQVQRGAQTMAPVVQAGAAEAAEQQQIDAQAGDLAAEIAAGGPAPVGEGTPGNPLVIERAGHAVAAGERVEPEPTDAQKEAGNYRKGHVEFQGLNVTIENPKGAQRRGTGPQGPWEVTMPAHYGYVKRSEGADGDQVDVYIGDAPASRHVLVVDQIDPVSGKFDEHKVMMGFTSPKQALETYKAGFSDASGARRVGAVKLMGMDQFKEWLKSGDTTKPVAYNEAMGTAAHKAAREINQQGAQHAVPTVPEGQQQAPASERPATSGSTASQGRPAVQGEASSSATPAAAAGPALHGETEGAAGANAPAASTAEPTGNRPGGIEPVQREEGRLPAAQVGKVSADDFAGLIDEAIAENRPSEPQPPESVASEQAAKRPTLRPVAGHAAAAVKEGLAGLDALFGGKGRLGSGPAFDEATWAQAKPHFDAAFDEFVAAGKSLKEYVRFILERYGSAIVPYLKRWHAEQQQQGGSDVRVQPGQSSETRQGPLEGQPAADVQEPPGKRPAQSGVDRGGEPVASGDGAAATGRPQPAGSVGPGQGVPHPPASGTHIRTAPGNTGVQRPGGKEPGANDRPGVTPGEPTPVAGNFVITDELELGKGGPVQKYNDNVAAIKLVKKIEAEGRMATPDEQKALARYVGWGGIKQAFPAPSAAPAKGWESRVLEVRELLTPEEHEAAARSIQDAHYTSKTVVDGIWSVARRLGFDFGRVSDLSVGVGNFFGLMPLDMRGNSRLTGIELDSITARIAKQLYPHANIIAAPMQDVFLADGLFNLNVGNPPFGEQSLYFPSDKHLKGHSIHNQFFMRAIDKLAPGGLHIQVVSRYLMDAKAEASRAYLAHRAELVGAIRLPWTAFYENARTEVVTDIIILKKLPESKWGTADQSWVQTKEAPDPLGGEPMRVNAYFAAHPEMIVGEMNRSGEMRHENDITVQPVKDEALEAGIARAIERLPTNIYERGKPEAAVQAEQKAAVAPADVEERYSVGNYYEHAGKVFQKAMNPDGSMASVEINANTPYGAKSTWGKERVKRLRGMVRIRDAARSLLAAEASDQAVVQLDKQRKALNRAYDQFNGDYGYLNDNVNRTVFRDDPIDAPLLLGLERDYDRGVSKDQARRLGVEPRAASAKKMPIFTQRVVHRYARPTSADTPADGLAISIAEKGLVSIDYIAELTGKSNLEVVMNLTGGENPAIYLDPANNEYMLANEYLSGNVKKKHKQARDAGLMEQADKLRAAFPADLKAADIRARLGAHWIDRDAYEGFVKHLLGEGASSIIRPVPATGGFLVQINGGDQAMRDVRWGSPARDAADLLDRILNNRDMAVRRKDENGNSYVDIEATQAANDKADEIRNEFEDWIFADAERRERLVTFYNDNMNTNVETTWDGEYLTFPGKVPDEVIKLRRSQKNGVARGIRTGKVLFDHVVGSGKTYTAIGLTMEMRRVGLWKKPMLVVPNHLVIEWATQFYRLYPGAKILTMKKSDFAKENRQRMLARVATGDWDAVIFAHSSFGFIGNDREVVVEFLRAQIAEIQAAIDAARQVEGKKSRTAAQYQKTMEKLLNRLKELMDKPRDQVLTFQQLGVDAIIVDESQEFKNLFFTTMRRNVGGFGNPAGSKKAFDLYMKASWLQRVNNGKGVVFMTGTPVSNSLTEIFTLQRYLGAEDLQARGLTSLDAWLAAFGVVESEYESNVVGTKYKRKERLRRITNAPELMQLYKSFQDGVTNEDIKRNYREDNNGAEFPIPKVASAPKPRENVAVEPSAAQVAFSGVLQERMDNLPRTMPKDNALAILGDGRKAALDIRLVNPGAEDHAGSKVNEARDNIVEIYKANTARLGTQLVFLDISTPLKHGMAAIKGYLGEARKLLGQPNAAPLGGNVEQWRELRRLLIEQMDSIEEGDSAERSIEAIEKFLADEAEIEAAANTADSKFSVYDDLREKLIAAGVPGNEIAFIHDYNGDVKKQDLFDQVNAGRIRVLMGSTAKMGAGTNVQRKVVALHHLDCPWRPSDIEQREGRVIRFGNEFRLADPNFTVRIVAYSTKGTSDVFFWQTQEQKLNGINSLRNFKGEREIEEVSADAMSAAEMKALASGNPLILEDVQLTESVRKLEAQRRRHSATQQELESEARKYQRWLDVLPAEVERQRALVAKIDAYKADPFAGQERPTLEVDGAQMNAEQAQAHAQAAVTAAQEKAREQNAPIEAKRSELQRQVQEQMDKGVTTVADALQGQYTALAKQLVKPEWTVTLNGKQYHGLDTLHKAIVEALGDVKPINMRLRGEPLIRRSDIIGVLDEEIQAIDDVDGNHDEHAVEFGDGITVELTNVRRFEKGRHQRAGIGVEVTIGGETRFVEEYEYSAGKGAAPVTNKVTGDRVLSAIMALINADIPGTLRDNERNLRSAQDGIAKVKEQVGKPWGKDLELDTKKARLTLVRKTLAGDLKEGERGATSRQAIDEAGDTDVSALKLGADVTVIRGPNNLPKSFKAPGGNIFGRPQIMGKTEAGDTDVWFSIGNPQTGIIVGEAILEVSPEGQIVALTWIGTRKEQRLKGNGRRALRTIMAYTGGAPILIRDIQDAAKPFWKAVGAQFDYDAVEPTGTLGPSEKLGAEATEPGGSDASTGASIDAERPGRAERAGSATPTNVGATPSASVGGAPINVSTGPPVLPTIRGTLRAQRHRDPAGTPAPATGAPDVDRVRAIIDRVQDVLGLPRRQGRMKVRGALGTYDSGSGVIRQRVMDDFEVFEHEVGHAISQRHKAWLKPLQQRHRSELRALSYQPVAKAKQMEEGFAEFMRLYVTNRPYALANARGFGPAFEAEFRKRDPELAAALDDAERAYSAWLDAPSQSVVKASVVPPPGGGKGIARFISTAKEDGFGAAVTDMSRSAYTAFVDDLTSIRIAVEALRDLQSEKTGQRVDLKAIDNAYKLARLSVDAYAAGHMDIMFGVREFDGVNPVGPGLSEALADALGKDAKGWTPEALQDFESYLVSRRAVQEWARYDTGKLPNPPTKESQADHVVNITELEAAHSNYSAAAAKVYAFAGEIWKKKRDAGLITQAQYQAGVDDHPDYVPFRRDVSEKTNVHEAVPGTGITGKASVLKGFKGSQRDIVSPIRTMMQDAYATAATIARNEAVKALATLAKKSGPGSANIAEEIPATQTKVMSVPIVEALESLERDPSINPRDALIVQQIAQALDAMDLPEGKIYRRGMINEKGEPIVYWWQDGERHALRLADHQFGLDLYQALTGLGREQSNLIINALAAPAAILRYGVTTDPSFFISNILRDQISAWVLAPHGYTPFVDAAKGIYGDLARDDMWRIYNSFGGIMGGANVAALDRKRMVQDFRAVRNKGMNVRRFATWRALAEVSEISETGTRVGIFRHAYEAALKRGASPREAATEAAFEARDYLDFGRHGSRMLAARRIATFLNASIQAMDKAVRVLGGQGNVRRALAPYLKSQSGMALSAQEKGELAHSAKAWFKVVEIAALGLLASLLARDDKEYEEFPQYLRATHWLFHIGDHWYAYPKPYELAFLSNIGETAFEALYHKDASRMALLAERLSTIMLPPLNVPAVTVPFEVWANKRVFDNREIVPERVRGREPYLQFTHQASRIGKTLGAQLNVSPEVIDHIVKGYGGTLGKTALWASKLGDKNAAESGPQDMWVLSRFVREPARGAMSSTEFWKQMTQDGQSFHRADATFVALATDGSDEAATRYLNSLPPEKQAYVVLKRAAALTGNSAYAANHPLVRAEKAIQVTQRLRDEIAESLEFSPRAKRLVDDALGDRVMTEARNALILTGMKGWTKREYMSLADNDAQLERASGKAAEMLQDRLAGGHIVPWDQVKEGFPELRNDALGEMKADILDAVSGGRTSNKRGVERLRRATPLEAR